MSTTDKLTNIANNVSLVYNAGFQAGQSNASATLNYTSITRFDFGSSYFDDMNGYKEVQHSLGKIPSAVSITVNTSMADMQEAGLNTIPDGKTAYTLGASRIQGAAAQVYFRYANDGTLVGSSISDTVTERAIYEITDQYVRIKPPAAAFPWPSAEIATFTLTCTTVNEEETINET